MDGRDAQSLMLFEAGKKSLGVAYALWFLMGFAGGHRFYAGRPWTAIGLLLLTVLGLATGGLLWIASGIWLLADAFFIPGWIRRFNSDLAARIWAGGKLPA
jgi:TM2 domain-containing membrane protein YozV